MLVSLRLDENVKDLAFGVDCAPEIDYPAADSQIDLVQMPSRMRLRATLAQVGCDNGSEIIHPPPDGLVRDHNPALGEQVFDVAEAEREPEVQPNRLVNDLSREPVARIADFLHPLGYRASKAPASGRCRDNALGTISNTLNEFARRGLLREIALYDAKLWYDTKTGSHFHFYREDTDELSDIPDAWLPRVDIPAPEGTRTTAVDIIVRLKRA